mgnify:CR=1 FL=1
MAGDGSGKLRFKLTLSGDAASNYNDMLLTAEIAKGLRAEGQEVAADKVHPESEDDQGDTIALVPTCGFFITMNPGYAGRQALPENLKALFRGVMMMVPNFQIIKKVKLCSVGYSQYEMLSFKFFVLYDTCKLQLSNQKHYDWGLRAVKSILVIAGGLKRADPVLEEDGVLMRALRDCNLPKLVLDDVEVFLGTVSMWSTSTARLRADPRWSAWAGGHEQLGRTTSRDRHVSAFFG